MERRGENKTQQNVLREDENEEKKKELWNQKYMNYTETNSWYSGGKKEGNEQ
jgi:hypothetical protein